MQGQVFFRVIMECRVDEEDSFIQVFWTWARDIGAAIARVRQMTLQENPEISDCWAAEADVYDFADLPESVFELDASGVFSSGDMHYFPTDPPVLKLPLGVIYSAGEGEFEPEDLHVGYQCFEDGDLLGLQCVVPDGDLLPVFMALVRTLPEIRVSWVSLSAEWERGGKKQLFSNESLNTPQGVEAFLQGETLNVIQNGWVEFTVYSTEGASNLLINEHKEISLLTYDQGVRQGVMDGLHALGIEASEELKSISQGCYHWHYQPEGALGRGGLIEHLHAQGFKFWKEMDVVDED